MNAAIYGYATAVVESRRLEHVTAKQHAAVMGVMGTGKRGKGYYLLSTDPGLWAQHASNADPYISKVVTTVVVPYLLATCRQLRWSKLSTTWK